MLSAKNKHGAQWGVALISQQYTFYTKYYTIKQGL